MRHVLGAAALIWFALSLTAYQTAAQDATCAPLVEEGFSAVEQHCSALDMNAACYGFGTVSATFADESEANFSQPGDHAPLTDLYMIQTARLDPTLEQWGVAVLNVQANIPASMGNHGVKYILLGDVMVENGVAASDAAQPAEPIDVTTLVGTNIRSGPGTDSRVITSVPAGTGLKADAISEDGAWLRVQLEDQAAWASLSLLAPSAPVDTLPAAGDESQTPMQKFYFQAVPAAALCDGGLPSLLVVQAPNGVPVDLIVNDVNIRLTSTITFWQSEDGVLHALTLAGTARVDGFYLPAGFTIEAPLSEDGRSLAGTWTNFRPLDADERQMMQNLELLPSDVLNYPIVLPSEADVQTMLAAIQNTASQNTTNTQNTGSTNNTAQNVSTGAVDCSRFRPTSPTDGMSNSSETFYWDAAQGADNYQLKIFNESGSLLGTFMTNSSNTALTIDTSNSVLGDGFFVSWQVDALLNGQVACTSSLVSIPRGGGAQPVGTGGGGDDDDDNDDNDNPGSGSGWGN